MVGKSSAISNECWGELPSWRSDVPLCGSTISSVWAMCMDEDDLSPLKITCKNTIWNVEYQKFKVSVYRKHMSKDYGVITRSRSKSTSVMSRNEVEAVLESMLALIKSKLEEIVTEKSMITHFKWPRDSSVGKNCWTEKRNWCTKSWEPVSNRQGSHIGK